VGVVKLLDPQPLLDHVARRLDGDRVTAVAVADMCGTSLRQVQRWQHGQRISWSVADRIACALHVHPVLIWPEWFPTTPTRKQHQPCPSQI